MNIGFYGHSSSIRDVDNNVNVYIDKIVEHYNGVLVHEGVPQGSEERILFDLKKTKKLDLAIIVHSLHRYLFLPGCKRDIDIKHLSEKRFQYVWNKSMDNFDVLSAVGTEYFNYGGIDKVFGNEETFITTLLSYKQYLHHPDLMMNRYLGAVHQIDQYLYTKQIPCVHIHGSTQFPSWVKFQSGISLPTVANMFNLPKEDVQTEKMQHRIYEALVRGIDKILVDSD